MLSLFKSYNKMDSNSHDHKPSVSILNRLMNWLNPKHSQCSTVIPMALLALTTTGCLCLMAYKYGIITEKSKKMREDNRSLSRSTSIGLLHGGKLAILRLIDAQNALADTESLKIAEEKLNPLLDQDEHDFRTLQSVVVTLEMSGKEEMAIEKLKEAMRKAEGLGKHHEAYEIEMLIVEMLIYQGKHEDAKKCKCLIHEDISDARRPLYKAIISIIEGNTGLAKDYWEKFREIRQHFKSSYDVREPVLTEVSNNFDKFKHAVNNKLKEQMQDATTNNKTNNHNLIKRKK